MSVTITRLYTATDEALGVWVGSQSDGLLHLVRRLAKNYRTDDYDYAIKLTWEEAAAAQRLLTEVLMAREKEER